MILKRIFPLLAILHVSTMQAQRVPDSIATGNRLSEVIISKKHISDSLASVPASIGILSPTQLLRESGSEIVSPANTIAGVYMQSGGFNTNRITIRGIGARTPFGTNKIRAFYGGIPLTSGDSETTIEDIGLDDIGQLEVIKGPLSSIYGAGLGGAIIITPKFPTSTKASAGTTFGSSGLLKSNLIVSESSESATLGISYHKLESTGWRENSAYFREGLTVSGELFRRKKGKLTYFGNHTYLKGYIPSSIDKATFDSAPESAAPTWKAAQGFERYHSWLGGLAYDIKVSEKTTSSTSIFINHKESDEPRPFDILLQQTTGYGARSQVSGKLSAKLKTDYIFGLEYFADHVKGRTFENLYQTNNSMGSVMGTQLTEIVQDRNFYNVFGQLRIRPFAKAEIQAGLNVNKTQFKYDPNNPGADLALQKKEYDAIWSPQLALLYRSNRLQTVYASVSRGFSLPGIEETLTADGAVNPDIRPETGYNFEIGQKSWWLRKKLYTEITLYTMQVKDQLVAHRVGDDQYVGVNAGETLHQGIEFLFEYEANIAKNIAVHPFLSASIGHFEFREFVDHGTDFSGNELTGVPANKVNAGCTLRIFDFDLYAGWLLVDKIPINDANTAYTDGYGIVNLKAGWSRNLLPKLHAQIAFGINNVANAHYASMVSVNAVAFGNRQPRYYYPGQPVNYYGSFAFSYDFD
jgi:iron complex outermembrane receptor protein